MHLGPAMPETTVLAHDLMPQHDLLLPFHFFAEQLAIVFEYHLGHCKRSAFAVSFLRLCCSAAFGVSSTMTIKSILTVRRRKLHVGYNLRWWWCSVSSHAASYDCCFAGVSPTRTTIKTYLVRFDMFCCSDSHLSLLHEGNHLPQISTILGLDSFFSDMHYDAKSNVVLN